MCGFAGILNRLKPLSVNELEAVSCNVAFRGPDSTNVLVLDDQLQPAETGRSGLFFNRLAIIDLHERSDQPFERDNCVLIFNGEIYNYKQLRQELIDAGINFETTSDTEVLFYVLKYRGAEGIQHLNGMFSFFWLDRSNGNFIVARDRIGIKPLYFSQNNGQFSFGSELNSLVRLQGGGFEVDADAVRMYLWMQYVPTPYTIVKGISKLAPGHYIEGNYYKLAGHLQPQCYWDAYTEASTATDKSAVRDLEPVLVSTLEKQLNADVPLGLFLSSGVDSSLLASLVSKHFRGQEFNFFTVAFSEETPMDESAEAKAFIDGFKNKELRWHSLDVNPDYIGRHLDELYHFYDEPFADYSSLMTWVVSRKAREHVTVAISGDGADELFYGYPRYNRWEKIGEWQKPVITPLMQQLIRLLPASPLKNHATFALETDPVRRHFDMFLSSGLRFLIADSITNQKIWAMEGVERLRGLPGLPAVLDLKTYLPDTMLYKVDRSSMAASLEVRVPFLDNKVIDFALGLDFTAKSNAGFKNKAILKNLLLELAPHYDVNRKKRGFTFPMQDWLKHHWKERVLQTVTKESLHELGLDEKPYIKIVQDYYYKNTSHFTDVWTIFSLIHWHQTFKSGLLSAPAGINRNKD